MLSIRDETFHGLYPFTPHYYSHPILHRWQQLYPHATTHEIEDASHFLQEDAPERIIPLIETFLRANP